MESESWNIECSDDECDVKVGNFEPPVEEIERLYSLFDEGKFPEFQWQSPGYRSPTPTHLPQTPQNKEELVHTEEKSDFDFMDEMSSLKLPVRREGEAALKGSAKKKTTSLDGVLSNMRRHRRLEQQMLDPQQPPTSSS